MMPTNKITLQVVNDGGKNCIWYKCFKTVHYIEIKVHVLGQVENAEVRKPKYSVEGFSDLPDSVTSRIQWPPSTVS